MTKQEAEKIKVKAESQGRTAEILSDLLGRYAVKIDFVTIYTDANVAEREIGDLKLSKRKGNKMNKEEIIKIAILEALANDLEFEDLEWEDFKRSLDNIKDAMDREFYGSASAGLYGLIGKLEAMMKYCDDYEEKNKQERWNTKSYPVRK